MKTLTSPVLVRVVTLNTAGAGAPTLPTISLNIPSLEAITPPQSGLIQASTEKLRPFSERIELHQSRFSELESWLILLNRRFDYVLADVGVSSEQLASAERGFSFMEEGPLDMRMDRDHQTLTAGQLLAKSNENKLKNTILTK